MDAIITKSIPTNVTMNFSTMIPLSAKPDDGKTVPNGCVVFSFQSDDFVPWNNPHNILSQEVPEIFDKVVGTVCLPVLFLISVPANILNMLVFWKQGLRERINLCLFYLSLVDFLHNIHAFICNIDRFYLPFREDVETGPVFQFIVEYKILGLRGLTWLSGFVSMVIACERCLCVVSPLRSQTVLSTRSTGFILALATVFILTGSLVNGMRWSLPCVYDPLTNTTSTRLLTSRFYALHRAHLNVLSLFAATIQPLTYVVVIVVTTIVMAVKLQKMVAWREQSSSCALSSQEVALTRMLIAVSILYIVCGTPNMTLGIGIMFVPGVSFSGRYYNLAIFLLDFTEIASYVNATFNFFIYYSMGSKYKHTLRTLIMCKTRKLVSNASS